MSNMYNVSGSEHKEHRCCTSDGHCSLQMTQRAPGSGALRRFWGDHSPSWGMLLYGRKVDIARLGHAWTLKRQEHCFLLDGCAGALVQPPHRHDKALQGIGGGGGLPKGSAGVPVDTSEGTHWFDGSGGRPPPQKLCQQRSSGASYPSLADPKALIALPSPSPCCALRKRLSALVSSCRRLYALVLEAPRALTSNRSSNAKCVHPPTPSRAPAVQTPPSTSEGTMACTVHGHVWEDGSTMGG